MFWLLVSSVLGSFVVAQLLLAWMQHLRMGRIELKSKELCESAAAGGSSAGVAPQSIPITIITGFLGSGKTTLVNRILTGDHGRRILVIENELGAISIDHALIDEAKQASAPAGVVVLKNGCMCCSGESPGSELERVLDKLLEMGRVGGAGGRTSGHSQGTHGGSAAQAASVGLPFDYVLIEMSGLADPGPVMQVLWRQKMAHSPFYLDGVVTVVDACNVLRHLRPTGAFAFTRSRHEAEKQVAVADRLIVNKVDLVADSDDTMEAVEDALTQLNAAAPQVGMDGTQPTLADTHPPRAPAALIAPAPWVGGRY
jgi:G3E family GTPase